MTNRDPLRHIIGTCAAQIGAISTSILSPLIIGGLIIGLGIGEIEAGKLVTVELLVIGIASILLAPLMARLPHHLLALAGAVILILAHLLSMQSAVIDELYAWRILAGLGCGCLVATVNAAIAQAQAPTLLYGLAWATGYTMTAILAVLISETHAVVSFDVVYRYLAIAMLFTLPFLWLVPRHGALDRLDAFPPGSMAPGCSLMLGIMLIGISMMAYYAFLGQLAVRINASAAETGRIVAAAQVAGIIGGLSVAPLAKRLGDFNVLRSTTILHVLSIGLAIVTTRVFVLGLAAFLEAALFIIMIPLMFTLAAHLDRKGRWAAAAGGIFILSTAFGPLVGALLIDRLGYQAIAWIQVLAAVPALCIFTRVNRTLPTSTYATTL